MNTIQYRQPIYRDGQFVQWHYWGFINDNFVAPLWGTSDLNNVAQQSKIENYLAYGQPDSKGKQIFEGDILELSNKDGKRVVVVCVFGTAGRQLRNFVGEINECQITGFYFLINKRYPTFPIVKNYAGKNDLEIMTIIGNIVENKELIVCTTK